MPFDIPPNINPKSQKEVKNNGRPKGNKRNINEIQPHTAGRNIHFFA